MTGRRTSDRRGVGPAPPASRPRAGWEADRASATVGPCRSAGQLASSSYVSLGAPLGLVWGVVLASALAAGVGASVALVGLPLLAGTLILWRWGANTERDRAGLVQVGLLSGAGEIVADFTGLVGTLVAGSHAGSTTLRAAELDLRPSYELRRGRRLGRDDPHGPGLTVVDRRDVRWRRHQHRAERLIRCDQRLVGRVSRTGGWSDGPAGQAAGRTGERDRRRVRRVSRTRFRLPGTTTHSRRRRRHSGC